jgi:hypothetical protein
MASSRSIDYAVAITELIALRVNLALVFLLAQKTRRFVGPRSKFGKYTFTLKICVSPPKTC